MAGVGLQGFAWLIWLLRLLCEFKLFGLVLLDLVIFPSFLFISKLNLFSCLCLTLLNNTAQSANHEVQSKGHIVIPYTQGLCESIRKICGRYGIQTHFKGGRTIKNLLVSPKDKDPMVNQSGAIYRYQCGDLGCDDEYIGETSKTFGERYKEHPKAPSAIHHHSIQTGHPTNQNNFQIVGREGYNLARNIKESIYIRVNNPSLNNNIGKFNLSHIWDRVLLNTKGLTLK